MYQNKRPYIFRHFTYGNKRKTILYATFKNKLQNETEKSQRMKLNQKNKMLKMNQ